MGIVARDQQRAITMNIPNLLSIVRILAIPVVVAFLSSPSPLASFLAALVFSLASLTDLLDGYIARHQKRVTVVGKLLDPMADKLLILSSMVMLIPLGRIPAWMVLLIIGREVAVTGLRGIASAEGMVIEASRWGKGKLVFQTLSLIGLMLHYEYLGINFHLLGMILLWVALVSTLWSGIDYFKKFYWKIQDLDREHRPPKIP